MARHRHARPPVLIESWLPVEAIGVESAMRDASAARKPPLNRLHVWWARRPPTACRAAILASLLPPDTPRDWFLRLLGIFGDPVAAKQRILAERRRGVRTPGNKFGYPRACSFTPDRAVLDDLFDRLRRHWGSDDLRVLDPMAGGGSIPLEAVRYGFASAGGELNPVAYTLLKAGIELPLLFGEELIPPLHNCASLVGIRAARDLEPFYTRGEPVSAYLWVRTTHCPACGLVVPLSPNWWLQTRGQRVAVCLVVPKRGNTCRFRALAEPDLQSFDPGRGTLGRGGAQCPRCGAAISRAALRVEAQGGRMGRQLYAVVAEADAARRFRAPTRRDFQALAAAEAALAAKLPAWRAAGLVPDEPIPPGLKSDEPRRFGARRWTDLFTPRQLLAHLTCLEHIRAATAEAKRQLGHGQATAVATLLACVFDKCLAYNNILVRWHTSRTILVGAFDRHAFGFKWRFAEGAPHTTQWPWAAEQVVRTYAELAEMLAPRRAGQRPAVTIAHGDAATAAVAEPGSCHLVCVDPPYADNVMYAELSDFFYVWQKRLLSDIFPEAFQAGLTDKAAEAVANRARFRGRQGARALAVEAYEAKMRACFEQMHRQLRPDGVLTVMFTHKQLDAWDTLAAALMDAGFEITASWPIHTESEHSLHQARKHAAAATILLVCRKRQPTDEPGRWEDILPDLRRAARAKARAAQEAGMAGIDLYAATFGAALRVLGARWPVPDGQGGTVRPMAAVEEARRVVDSIPARGASKRTQR